jgi:hypothetical protein
VHSLPYIPQAIKYLHGVVGVPTKDTWVKAIKNGNYVSWPGLIVKAVNKHFPESIETQQGHTKKQRQNVKSTKQKLIIKDRSNLSCDQTQHIGKSCERSQLCILQPNGMPTCSIQQRQLIPHGLL